MNPARDYQRIERAIGYLARHAHTQPPLANVAAHVGLSEYHFQRLFRRWAGISPKRFVQYLTAEHARSLLQASRSALDVSLEAGLSGTGRLHDLMVAIHAATPGEIKSRGAGLTIDYGVHSTPFGDCLLALTARGLCGLEFLTPLSKRAALARIKQAWPAATFRENPTSTRAITAHLFVPGRASRAPLPLHVRGTNFQIKVWEALLRIPPGDVLCYEDVARLAGEPDATRAAASAVAQNRIGLFIPCHRVIRKSGAIGEYRWGAKRKQILLAWEAASATAQHSGRR